MTLWTFRAPAPRIPGKWFAWHPVLVYTNDWMESGDSKIVWLANVWRKPGTYMDWVYKEIGGNDVQG